MKMVNSKKLFVFFIVLMLLTGSFMKVLAQEERDLTSFLDKVEIHNINDPSHEVEQNGDGEYIVEAYREYDVKLHFKEQGENHQFPSGTDEITYQLPDGLTNIRGINNQEFAIALYGDHDDFLGDVWGNYYSIVEENEHVYLKMHFADNEDLLASTSVEFGLLFSAKFAEGYDSIDFGNGIEKKIDINDTHDVDITKKSYVCGSSICYTLTAKVTGSNTNVRISDAFASDSILTMDTNSLVCTKNGQVISCPSSATASGFVFDFGNLSDHDIVEITYKADLKPDFDPATYGSDNYKLTAEGTTNEASIESDEDPNPKPVTHNLENVDYASFEKYGKFEKNGEIVTWTIKINSGGDLLAMAGSTITDKIDEASQSYLSYDGNGITIQVTDELYLPVATRYISWSDLGVNNPATDKHWTYNFPPTDGKYRYTITYQTKTDTSSLLSDTTVKNEVENEKLGEKEGTAVIEPPVKLEIIKSHSNVTERTVDWKIDITVPGGREINSFILTDTYPAVWSGQNFIDSISGSARITGDVDPELCLFDTTSNEKFIMTCYKDNQHTQPGLPDSAQDRTITVEFTGAFDQNWLNNDNLTKAHTNTAHLDVNNQYHLDSTSTVHLEERTVKKVASEPQYDSNGMPFYEFVVTFTNVDDPDIEILDKFDKNIFRVYDEYSIWDNLYFKNGYNTPVYNDEPQNRSKATVTYTEDGAKFSITLPTTEYTASYTLKYYLIVKNEAALQTLREEAAQNDGLKVFLENTASYKDASSSVDFYYDYNPVDKTMVTARDDLTNTASEFYRKPHFKITFNPTGMKLNDGENITIKDTFSSTLNIDYSSIRFTPADSVVSYNVSGYTGTYIVRDSVPVTIEYDAFIVGTDADTSISNTVTALGHKKTVTEEHLNFSSGEQGSAHEIGIYVLKQETNAMEKPLAGAVFQLYSAQGENSTSYKTKISEMEKVTYKREDEHGNFVDTNIPITITTGADGIAHLRGGKQAETDYTVFLNPDHWYSLYEITFPNGYKVNPSVAESGWLFKIPDDPAYVDTGSYIYPDGYTMRIDNVPKTPGIALRKTIDGITDLTDEQKQNILFTVTDSQGNVIKTVSYDQFSGSGWYTIYNLTPGTYTVTESAEINGYTVTTTYNTQTVDDIEVLITEQDITNAQDTAQDYGGIHNVNIANTYTPKTAVTEVSATKKWLNADGTPTPPAGASVTFRLYQNGNPMNYTVVLNGTPDTPPTDTDNIIGYESEAWVAKFINLTPKDENEDAYTYTIKEVPPYFSDYTPSPADPVANGGTITNKQDSTTTEVSAEKKWKNADGTTTNPDGATVEFTLYKGNTPTNYKVTLDGTTGTRPTDTGGYESAAWVATFVNLPKYQPGTTTEIEYTVKETTTYPGYTSSTADGTITNTQETTSANATKKWKNADGTTTHPDGATVEFTLYKGNTPTNYKVTLDGTVDTTVPTTTGGYESEAWKATFVNLPKYQPGTTTEINYSIRETSTYPGYTSSASGDTITNTQEKTEIAATKAWVNSDGTATHPEGATVEFTLYDGDTATNYKVTLDGTIGTAPSDTGGYESEAWKATFVNLPKYQAGTTTEINYSIRETSTYPGYTSSASGDTITNTQEKTEIAATKAWVNADGTATHPEGATVEFTLYDGDTATNYKVTLDGTVDTAPSGTAGYEYEAWKAKFVNLPKYKIVGTAATEIIYKVQETTTYPGYTSSTADGTITNTQETTSANATKKWKNADGTTEPPTGASVVFTLFKDGSATSYTVTLNGNVDSEPTGTGGYESEAWKAKFVNLPKYQPGTTTEITYTVQETTTYPGYTPSTTEPVASGGTITNTQVDTSVEATKAWKNADGTTTPPSGATVVFTLYDGENATNYKVTLDGEVDTPAPDVTAGYESEAWKATFVNLPKYKIQNGNPTLIEYKIKETTSYTGYTPSTTDPVVSGTTITNTQIATTATLKVKKEISTGQSWPDGAEATFTLTASKNGDPMPAPGGTTVTLTETKKEDSFGEITYTLAHAGKTYEYHITETETFGGGWSPSGTVTALVEVKNENNTLSTTVTYTPESHTITNSYSAAGSGEIKVEKILEGRGWNDNDVFTFTLTPVDGAPMPDSTEITVKKDSPEYTASFGEIPFTKAGEYRYIVKETKGKLDGIIYDENEHPVTIKVKDDGEGHLIADGTPLIQTVKITNICPKDAEIELEVRKSFTGSWKQGQTFTFTLSSPDGAPMPGTTEITVTAGERIKSFGTITITADDMKDESGSPVKERTFTYEITEVVPEAADENGVYEGIRYDRSVQTFRITARMDVYGNIVVLGPEDGIYSVTFTNSNEEKITPTPMRFYRLPKTGFSAVRPTVLSEQPKDLSYRPLAWTLEIPSLALITDIVEVPFAGGEYPVTWLGSSAGLLEGFGLPGKGSSVLTGHNHLNTMEAGPFVLLKEMGIGDRIFVLDPENEMQIFAVYANEKIAETDVRGLERIAGRFDNSLTLITCEDERTGGGYANRRIIAAKPVD